MTASDLPSLTQFFPVPFATELPGFVDDALGASLGLDAGTALGPALTPASARRPALRIGYEGKDVTGELWPLLTSVTYSDQPHGESDELELVLEDIDGRWQRAWRPRKGDKLVAFLGHAGEPALPCGTFQVDEVSHRGPPRGCTIKALATPITSALRTRRTEAYENQTLHELVQRVADRHALKVIGTIDSIPLARVTQREQSDVAFLTRMATRYGYVVSVRDQTLTFLRRGALDAASPVAELREGEVTYELTTKTNHVYKSCTVRYDDPRTGKMLKATVNAPGVKTGDVLHVKERCESQGDAQRVARAALERSNRGAAAGRIELEGLPVLLAGSTVLLSDFGELAGTYSIERSRHSIARSGGYRSEIEIVQAGVVTDDTSAAGTSA